MTTLKLQLKYRPATLWGVRGPSPTLGSQAQSTSARKRSPTTPGVKIIESESESCYEPCLLEGPKHRLTLTISFRERVEKAQQPEPVTGGEERMGWLQGKGWRGSSLSRTEVLAGAPAPVLSSPPAQPAGMGGSQIRVSINIANITHPTLEVPWTRPHLTLTPGSNLSWQQL